MIDNNYTTELLDQIWEKIPPSGWTPIENSAVVIKLQKDSNGEREISFNFPVELEIKKISSTIGFDVEFRSQSDSTHFLLKELNDQDHSLFSYLCSNLLELCNQNRELSYKNRLSQLLDRIVAWQDFMKITDKQLSIERETGLLGELFVLLNILKIGIPFDSLKNLWQGPLSGSHDFFINSKIAMEVKTSLKELPLIAKINSLRQLDLGDLESLYLSVICCKKDQSGLDIDFFVQQIKANLKNEWEIAIFDSLLVSSGYIESLHKEKLNSFLITNNFVFNATDIPHLTFGNTKGILDAVYKISLITEDGGMSSAYQKLDSLLLQLKGK